MGLITNLLLQFNIEIIIIAITNFARERRFVKRGIYRDICFDDHGFVSGDGRAADDQKKVLAPPVPLEDQLCFSIYSAEMAIQRIYKPFLDELGLTYPQYQCAIAQGRTDRGRHRSTACPRT